MPALVDTTIRLLSQEPLAGRMPAAELLRLAEILDGAGFAYLEVSGGGVFDSAVRRGVETPWERIRGLKARTNTQLALALRGRFLVGSRPVGADFVRRFVSSAAESGIDVFRLHDPLNDVSNLTEAGEAITAAEREFEAGLLYSPGPAGETEALVEQARKLPELGAARGLLHDSSGAREPHRPPELVTALGEASALAGGLYCRGATGNALAAALEAARAGADLISCAVYPVALALHRVSGEALASALAGAGLDTGVDVDALWRASELVDEHLGDEPVQPLAPRIAVRAAQHKLPAGLVAALETRLRAYAAGDRLDEVLEELTRIRSEAGWPPLAAPIGQIVASQALVHVLSASRYGTVVDELRALLEGRFGTPPGEVDPALRRAVGLISEGADPEPEVELSQLRQDAAGLATREEELLLLALFGEEAEALLATIRARARVGEEAEALLTTSRARARGDEGLVVGALDQSRAERLKELVRVVQETGVGEITVEEAGTRVSVRRSTTEEAAPAPSTATAAAAELLPLEERPLEPPPSDGFVRIEAPMVGTFYRAPEPGAPPFVQE